MVISLQQNINEGSLSIKCNTVKEIQQAFEYIHTHYMCVCV